MSVWPHFAVMLACTLAAGRYAPQAPADRGTCPRASPCHEVDRLVTVHDTLVPVGLYFGACLLVYTPSLLLASQTRLQQLQEATMRVVALALPLAATWHLQATQPAYAYATCTHWVASLLCHTPHTAPLVGRAFHRAVSACAAAALLAYAWGVGPPLPVVDSPVAPMCCGAGAHLTGLAVAAVGLPLWGLVARQVVQADA